jgi:hypothetical protein
MDVVASAASDLRERSALDATDNTAAVTKVARPNGLGIGPERG